MFLNVALVFALRVGGTALWLLFTVICARVLTVGDFGQLFFAVNVILAGGAAAAMGYDVALLRFGARYWQQGRHLAFFALLREARRAVLGCGLLVLALFLAAAGLRFDTPVTGGFAIAAPTALAILATALMALNRDALRAAGKLRDALFGQSIIRTVVPAVLLSGLALAGAVSVQMALGCYLAGLLAALVWEQLRIRQLPRGGAAPAAAGRHWASALSVWPGEAALIVFHRAGGIMIGLTAGLEMAAMFLAAERVAQLGTFITDAVRTAVAPPLAQARGPDLQREVSRASLLMLISGCLGGLLLLSGGWILLAGFGRAYLDAYPVLCVLLAGQLSWAVLGPTALILNMQGQERLRSVIGVAAAAALILVLAWAGTALQTACAVAAISWAMNGALWLGIRIRTGVTAGVFGLSAASARQTLAEEVFQLRQRLSRRQAETDQ